MLYIAATLLLGFAAVNTGNNLLYLLVAALLGFMCSTGVAGWLNVRGLAVEILPPAELYTHSEGVLRLRISNRKRWLPSFLVTVPLAEQLGAFFFLPPASQVEQSITVNFTTRGRHRLPPLWVQSQFPASFFVRRWPAGAEQEIVVIPSPLPGALAATAGQTSGSELTLASKGWDGDLRAIVDYTGRESAKLIHWRLSARHDRLLVRELDARADEPVIINLDLLPAAGLEPALARAVAQINLCWRLQRPVGLIANGVRHEALHTLPHRLRLLREVALYGL